MRRVAPFLAVLAVCAVAPAWAAQDLVSRFTKSAEDWRLINGANRTWQATGGDPGGFLQGADNTAGTFWFFASPPRWEGDWSSYKQLTYDLILLTNLSYADYPVDVAIVGANGTTLQWHAPYPPGPDWTSFKVTLDAQTFNVSQEVFAAAMKHVTELHIRGEYQGGADIEGLDNVVVSAGVPDFSGTVNALPEYKLVCKNETTGQTLPPLKKQTSRGWDCEAAGLIVNDHDQVSATLSGPAEK